MGKMFNISRHELNNWRWDRPSALGDEVIRSNPQKTRLVKLNLAGEHFSSYGSGELMATVEQPACRLCKRGDFFAIRRLNRDQAIANDDDDENCGGPEMPSCVLSHPGHKDGNDDGNGEEGMPGGVTGTRNGRGRKDVNG
jgi:hypothetical protein